MNKRQIKLDNKAQICARMCDTAKANGKDLDLLDAHGLADRLHRLEATLTRLAEDECNYPVYDKAKQDRIEKLAEKLIKDNIGCECYTQRDPRGYCIRMFLVDDEGNPWYNTLARDVGLNW
jgi:hypothetical protein